MKQKEIIDARESGSKGGNTTKQKYGTSHYSKIAKERWIKQKKAKQKNG